MRIPLIKLKNNQKNYRRNKKQSNDELKANIEVQHRQMNHMLAILENQETIKRYENRVKQ